LAPFSPITPNLIEKDVHDLMQVDSSTASLQKTACLTKPKGRSVRWLRYLKMLVWGGVSMVFSSPGKGSEGQHFFGRRVAASRHSKA
jgi:hypothetical protein